MAAFRLAAKGKTMADSSYESEVNGIQAFLAMQVDGFKNTTAPGGVSFDFLWISTFVFLHKNEQRVFLIIFSFLGSNSARKFCSKPHFEEIQS